MPLMRYGSPDCMPGWAPAWLPAANTTTPPFATYVRDAAITSGIDDCRSCVLNEVIGVSSDHELLMIIAPALAARPIMSASCASLAVIAPVALPTLKLTSVALYA